MIPDSLDRVVEAVAGLVAKARDTLARRMEAAAASTRRRSSASSMRCTALPGSPPMARP